MDSRKPLLIVIVGPTAAGKSELAVRLAKKFNGEIISADSRQVYRGLDIGTGKISKRETRNVPHHCIDLIDPKEVFTVVDYQKCAAEAIRDIRGRGKLPFLVGGTGFWIDAVAHGLVLPAVPPNPALRRKLAKKSAIQLFAMLRRLDPERAKTIESKNPRRLIRAIEIAKAIGRVPKPRKRSPYRSLWIGLHPPSRRLRRRIGVFASKIIQRGLMHETKTLLSRVGRRRLHEFGFEYQTALAYLDGRLSRIKLEGELIRELANYARRQMAWFRRNREIHWVATPAEAEGLLRGLTARGTAGARPATPVGSP